jgi:hypothetical protein
VVKLLKPTTMVLIIAKWTINYADNSKMPDTVKADVEAAMLESERGEGISHEEVKKTYS